MRSEELRSMLAGMKRAPRGEVERTESLCPACLDGKLNVNPPCCGSPKGSFSCPKCGYREIKR